MSTHRRRRIAGCGFAGDTLHWIGKKLNGEQAEKTARGYLYVPKTAKPAPIYRGGTSPGGSSARLFGGRIRRRRHRARRLRS